MMMVEMERTNIFTFWRDLFINPKTFFEENLSDSKLQPAYFSLAIVVYGIGFGIDRLDRQLLKYDLQGRLADLDYLNDWAGYWVFAVIGGIIGGYISYLIGGWFFNVRLKWSKGTGDIDKSRYIYLYSGVVSSSIIFLTALVSMLLNDKPYDPGSEFNLWSLTVLILLMFFIYYSVFVSYTGVRAITDADKLRSVIWFLILPIIVYTLAYITIIILIHSYIV
jgi:hypothetical protein